MNAGPATWFLVPARGGSRGIPHKNVRHLAGKPLIRHVLDMLSGVADATHIVLSTDDDEIAAQARGDATVHVRSSDAASDAATLDAVAIEVARWLVAERGAKPTDVLMTIQPTSPFLSVATVRAAIARMERGDVDTVLSVTDDRHLRWTRDSDGRASPLFAARVNRQWLPSTLAESGGVICATIGHVLETGTRIGGRVDLLEVDQIEGLDIDDFADWAVAEYLGRRLQIVIRADSSPLLGYGHAYRAMALADALGEHDVKIVSRNDGDYALGYAFLESRRAPVTPMGEAGDFPSIVDRLRPQIIINDILDTDADYVRSLQATGAFVVNFEDLGPGIQHADLVINDLYPDAIPRANHWYGLRYAVLNSQFDRFRSTPNARDHVESVLLAFGGTDPSRLTELAVQAIAATAFAGRVVVVIGPGFTREPELRDIASQVGRDLNLEIHRSVTNMASLMSEADLAITSSGRTVTELMTVGVPAIAICQNMREMRHSHASSAYGVINLGLGDLLSVPVVAQHIRLFLDDAELRRDMSARMRRAVADRSNARIVNDVLDAYRTWKQKKETGAHSH